MGTAAGIWPPPAMGCCCMMTALAPGLLPPHGEVATAGHDADRLSASEASAAGRKLMMRWCSWANAWKTASDVLLSGA